MAVVVVPPVGVAKVSVGLVDALGGVGNVSFSLAVFSVLLDEVLIGEGGQGVVAYHHFSIECLVAVAKDEECFAVGSGQMVVGMGHTVGQMVVARQLALELFDFLVEQEATEVVVGGVLVPEAVGEHELVVLLGGMDGASAVGSEVGTDVTGTESVEGECVGDV